MDPNKDKQSHSYVAAANKKEKGRIESQGKYHHHTEKEKPKDDKRNSKGQQMMHNKFSYVITLVARVKIFKTFSTYKITKISHCTLSSNKNVKGS